MCRGPFTHPVHDCWNVERRTEPPSDLESQILWVHWPGAACATGMPFAFVN